MQDGYSVSSLHTKLLARALSNSLVFSYTALQIPGETSQKNHQSRFAEMYLAIFSANEYLKVCSSVIAYTIRRKSESLTHVLKFSPYNKS